MKTEAKKKATLRSNFKRIFLLTAGLIGVLLLCGVAYSWFQHGKLEDRLTVLRETGEPVSIADLKPDIAPEDNAATHLLPIMKDAEKLYADIESMAHREGITWEEGMTEEEEKKVAAAFEKSADVITAIDAAADCKGHRSPFDYTQPPSKFVEAPIASVQNIRVVARMNDCRGRYLASIGKPDEAAQVYLTQMRLCRLQDDEPLMISFLVNLACRGVALGGLKGVMQWHELKPETLTAIETELALHDPVAAYVKCLRTERAFGIESFRDMSIKLAAINGEWIKYLDFMEDEIAKADKPYYKAPSEMTGEGGLAGTVQPAIVAAREAMTRTLAEIRCVRVYVAVQQAEEKVEVIDVLDLPEEVDIDPYTGDPLLFKLADDGLRIYSVGKDGKDDGGSVSEYKDVGVAPTP